MRYQEYMCQAIQNAADEVFRYAKAVPEDKVEWKPLESGRSVLDMAREIAKSPDWAREVISSLESPQWSEEKAAAQKQEMEQWKTVAQCEEECKKRLERLFELYRGITDEQLANTKWLPYNGGRDHTVEEMMDYPRWNMNYHLGQIAYIQTLYGDREMY